MRRRAPLLACLVVSLFAPPRAGAESGEALPGPARCVADPTWPWRSLDLVRLEGGADLRVVNRRRAWGTQLVVERLIQVSTAYHLRFPDASPLWIHDISRPGGGPLRLHYSHRTGRDVDIRLIHRWPGAGYVDATPATLHAARMWDLLLRLIATCDVEFIMLDRELQRVLYGHALRKRVPREALGLILQYPYRHSHRYVYGAVVRHYPRHRNHMHVRFRREDAALETYSARALCTRPGLSDPRPLIDRVLAAPSTRPAAGR